MSPHPTVAPAQAEARGISLEKLSLGCLGAKSTLAGLSHGVGDPKGLAGLCVSLWGQG